MRSFSRVTPSIPRIFNHRVGLFEAVGPVPLHRGGDSTLWDGVSLRFFF